MIEFQDMPWIQDFRQVVEIRNYFQNFAQNFLVRWIDSLYQLWDVVLPDLNDE